MRYNLEIESDESQNKKAVNLICPICKKAKKVDIAISQISQTTNLTTISVQENTVCEHHFQAFIDKDFKVRGYQKVDLEIVSKYKLPKGDVYVKVIILGDYSVGKSAIARRFVDNTFEEGYIPTLNLNISKKTIIIKETNINFVIWDVGGQAKEMTAYRDQFYRGAQAGIVIVDRTRPETLEHAELWLSDAKKTIRDNVPIILVGNKSDLLDKIVISEQDLTNKAKSLGLDCMFTSAKSGKNIEELFLNLSLIYFKYREQY